MRKKTEKGKTSTRKKQMAFGKKIFVFLLLNAVAVEAYSMALMWHTMDTSALITLIGATISETIAFAIYCVKSTIENKVGGIVHDTAMKAIEQTNQITPVITDPGDKDD